MSYTLLLADDSVTIQRVIELTFADEDVQVVAVSDGDQAVERIESAPPDIVLADIGMPGRNGYEVARYVKQSPRLSHIPVVLLTGAFEPVDQARAAEVGSDGVLAKPFEPQLVISRVKELLTGQAKKSTPAAPPATITPPLTLAPPPSAAKSAQTAADLDDYFERLDIAFSNLSSGAQSDAFVAALPEPPTGNEIEYFASEQSPHAVVEAPAPAAFMPPPPPPHAPQLSVVPPPASAPAPAETPPPAVPRFIQETARVVDEEEELPLRAVEESAPVIVDTPAPVDVSAPAAEETTPARAATEPPAAVVEQTPPRARPELPSLGDAFAAILAAEQAATPSVRPAWPAPASSSPNGLGAGVSDDLVERVAREVLDRLSDRVVHERVTEIVTAVAERLVREEIERIKASIK